MNSLLPLSVLRSNLIADRCVFRGRNSANTGDLEVTARSTGTGAVLNASFVRCAASDTSGLRATGASIAASILDLA